MNESNLITLCAVFVAILSALYARRSASEAKNANKIALHYKMVEIYEEVSAFADCFRGIFTVPSSVRLEQFRVKGLHKSELYFSKQVYEKLREAYGHCNEQDIWLKISQDEEQKRISGVDIPHEFVIRSEYKDVLNILYPVLEQMKKEINEKLA